MEPIIEGTIHGIMSEIVSASSSLNMPPNPIPENRRPEDAMYLSEIDYTAEHTMEHLNALAKCVIKLQEEYRRRLSAQLDRFMPRLPEHEKIIIIHCAINAFEKTNDEIEEIVLQEGRHGKK